MLAQVVHHVNNEQVKMQISMSDVHGIYGVKSVLAAHVKRQIITGVICAAECLVCGMHALMHEHTIAKIWDVISPGWRNGPLSRGLSVLWKSLFNLFLLVLHKNTSSFFAISISAWISLMNDTSSRL